MDKEKFLSIMMMLMLVALPAITLSSCGGGDDDGPAAGGGGSTGGGSVSYGVEEVYITGATFKGYIDAKEELLSRVSCGVLISDESGVSIDNHLYKVSAESRNGHTFKATARGLQPSTTYYYRPYTQLGGDYVYGEEKQFKTKSLRVTASLVKVEGRTATIRCTTNLQHFDLQNSNNTYGIIWGTNKDLGEFLDAWNCEFKEKATGLDSSGGYNMEVKDIPPYTSCFCRAYTCTSGQHYYSNVVSFACDMSMYKQK